MFLEPIICVYIDLDVLIETCGLSNGEKRILKWVMLGYAMSDIADHYKIAKPTVTKAFQNIVKKITIRNMEIWEDTYIKKGEQND